MADLRSMPLWGGWVHHRGRALPEVHAPRNPAATRQHSAVAYRLCQPTFGRASVTVINGLPAHVLFVHFIVVLVPLTALLEIVCALWRAARRRLVWLVLVLAALTTVLTPITINAGEWLFSLRKQPSPILREHAGRGEWMIYFGVALLVVATLLAVMRVLESRSDERRPAAKIVVAVITLAVGISSMVQVYRVGDAGSQSVWGGEIARLKKSNSD
jgi:uncharacterized membrane protein